jgi:Tripartite tricarboxylate transporter family receptor
MCCRANLGRGALLFALAAWALSAWPIDQVRAAYPERLVRIVVPFAPGGGTDVIARALAQEMEKDLDQSVIIENEPGAGTMIGTQSVATSEADGYTLLMGTFANAVNPSLYAKLPYEPHKDFAPVALVARSYNIVVVNAKSQVNSIPELIAAAKAEPDKLSYGTYGTGTWAHLAGELFKSLAKVNLTTRSLQGRFACHHRSARWADPGDVHHGRERGLADRGRTVARAGSHLRRALAGLSRPVDGRGSGRAGLRRRELVRPVRAGQDPARDHRSPQQVGGEGGAIGGLQAALCQRRSRAGGKPT